MKNNSLVNMLDYYGNGHIYTAHEMQRASMAPLNIAAKMGVDFYTHQLNPFAYTPMGKRVAASCSLMERMTRKFSKPDFGITETEVNGETVKIKEKIIKRKTFCSLLHFSKQRFTGKQKKMLIVAPMSGHYATLLRGTVEGLLPHFDVYITDWSNAQDIPTTKGTFDLDDYIDYTMEFLKVLGKDTHVTAVCQPAVPVLAATAIMSSENNPFVPASITLMGGPIDTRKNPTEVNKLAETKSLSWFENNVISHVPLNYKGFMRPVYPGFVQLTGFMSMNLDRHMEAHMNLFEHLVEGDGESVESHKSFYNEYLSVMDIPAEFYLQTIKTVFQEHSLPKGEMVSRGRAVIPSDIKKTAILTIEGERDDISGRGQTKATLALCSNLSKDKKEHLEVKGAGHYGIFNGKRYRNIVVPKIVEFIEKS